MGTRLMAAWENYMAMKNFKSDEACIICFSDGVDICYHHLMTKKAHPEHRENPDNLAPVCQACHNLFNSKGTNYMATNYPLLRQWMLDRSWSYDAFQGKWRYYKK